MAAVDAARCGLETFPEHLLKFDGHGARLTPLVVQLLQLVESLDNRRLHHQRLGLLAKREFLFVVALQVQITQLLINFDVAVEVLDVEVVGLPQILHVGLRNGARLLPTSLQLTELGEGLVERLVRRDQLLQLVNNLQLNFEVLLLLLLQAGDVAVTAGAVLAKQLLEAVLGLIGRSNKLLLVATPLQEELAGSIDLLTANAVEGHLHPLDHTTQRLYGALLERLGEVIEQFGFGFAGKLILGQRLDLGSLLGRLLIQLQPRLDGSQLGLLGRKIYRHLSGCLLRNTGVRLGDGLFSSCRGSLHIFSHRADLLLGSRTNGVFGSHCFWVGRTSTLRFKVVKIGCCTAPPRTRKRTRTQAHTFKPQI